MHISFRSIAVLAAIAGSAVAAPVANAADRTVDLSPAATAANWTSATSSGLNVGYLLGTLPVVGAKSPVQGACAKDPQTYCDATLVHVTGDDIGDGSLTFRIDGFSQASDFDLHIFESDASGKLGKDISDPNGDVAATSPLGSDDPRHTAAGDYETTVIGLGTYLDGAGGPLDAYFLVQVPYFMVANDKFDGHVKLASTPFVPEDTEE